ncbi:MAG: phosphodiesterase, partial [Candidatus Krumholzibacteriota bacterium]|nr:phosphodiesterase [Candidatus Krumholzibacteriota bacterium]
QTLAGGRVDAPRLDGRAGPDDANHAQEGVFVWYNSGRPGARDQSISIYDIAPSILDFYGIDVPDEMIGSVI